MTILEQQYMETLMAAAKKIADQLEELNKKLDRQQECIDEVMAPRRQDPDDELPMWMM